MGAIELGLVGQFGDGGHGAEHIFGRAFEETPAAQGKNRIADKGGLSGRDIINDVIHRMARE